MDTLPQEILDSIVSYLQDDRSARLSLVAVSQKWQATLEKQSFRSIKLASTEFTNFRDFIHKHDRRRSLVRTITLEIVLPPYSDTERRLFEDDQDRQLNNEAFSYAIHSLFDMLQHWKTPDDCLALKIEDVYSSSDHPFLRPGDRIVRDWLVDVVLRHPSGEIPPDAALNPKAYVRRLSHRDALYERNPIVDLYAWRWRYSHVELKGAARLPEVLAIGSFETVRTTRAMSNHVPFLMATKMPNLTKAEWHLDLEPHNYPAFSQARRDSLAEIVATVVPGLKRLELLQLVSDSHTGWTRLLGQTAGHSGGQNTYSIRRDSGDMERDLFSDALRRALSILPALQSLVIWGAFDASLFIPSRGDPDAGGGGRFVGEDGTVFLSEPAVGIESPYWPSLKTLKCRFAAERPDGGTYFTIQADRPMDDALIAEVMRERKGNTDPPPGYRLQRYHKEHRMPGERVGNGLCGSERQAIRDAETANFTIHNGDNTRERRISGPEPNPLVADHDGSLSYLLSSFARACALMPRIQRAEIHCSVPSSATSEDGSQTLRCGRLWGVWWLRHGTKPPLKNEGDWMCHADFYEHAEKTRLFWNTPDWRPTEELRGLLNNIGTRGGSYVEKFVSKDRLDAYAHLLRHLNMQIEELRARRVNV